MHAAGSNERSRPRWWSDTLFKRLFLLMWFGLVGSHLLAFVVTRHVHAPPGASATIERLPVLPSLPPTGAPGPRAPGQDGGGPPPGPPPQGAPRDGPPPDGMAPPFDDVESGLPASALWLDYGVRFLAIGVVAWFGARWLSAPMRRLAAASETLGRALGERGARREALVPLDERRGTAEVQQTAQVFNTMARQLQAQFDAQDLLMASISHDLRTPLARLRLRLEGDAAVDSRACIADVRQMDALIGGVLEMMRSRQAPAPAQRVELRSIAQAMVDDLAEQGEPATYADPDGDASPAPAVVSADPAALARVLANLIGNALRHGGSARVAVHVDAQRVRVAVDDDGPGIPADRIDAVFAPFVRLAPDGGPSGSGLGLYIARDLAVRHGGTLTLANRSPRGLRAELSLPRAA